MAIKKIGFTIGKFAPLHEGHCNLIETAIKEMDKFVVIVYETNVISIPTKQRAKWIKDKYPTVEVICAYNPPMQYGLDKKSVKIQMKYLEKLILGIPVTHFYSSEPYGKYVAEYLNVEDRRIDQNREKINICATKIRNNIEEYRNYLDNNIYEECKKEEV